MSPYYRRIPAGRKENLGAAMVSAGLAIGVGSIAFYLVRTFLARETVPELPPRKVEGEEVPALPADADGEGL